MPPDGTDIIDDFLAQKRLAVVGAPRNPREFSSGLIRELRRRDYDVVPVNPHASEVDGQKCFQRVQDITPPVDAALLLTPAAVTEQVVRDCAEAGITRVWMFRAVGTGAVSQSAVGYCNENGMRVVAGACPYMFLPGAGFGHRLHGFLLKLVGRYPS
jgi:predicted CoA-binding protein